MSVRECLRKARFQLGMSQIDLATALGISKASISLYENGTRQPGFKSIRRIVDGLRKYNIHINYEDLRNDKDDYLN